MKEYTHMQTPDFRNLCSLENMNADMTHTWDLVTCPLCLKQAIAKAEGK